MNRVDVSDRVSVIGLGEWKASKDDDAELVCLGLGSCVALCAYDPVARVGGMAHMVLPSSREGRVVGPGAKFVDLGVPLLLQDMEKIGASRSRLVLKIAGGAHMISAAGFNGHLNIGERNAASARDVISQLGLRLRAEDVGGARGRTVRLRVGTGQVVVSTAGDQPYAL